MSKKRGALSTEEMNFITRNVHEMTIDNIAIALSRTTKPIQKYIEGNNLLLISVKDEEQLDVLRRKLKTRPYWKEVVKQLTKGELEYFVETWVNTMLSFNEDVVYLEELNIKRLVTLEILMDRSMKQRKSHEEDAQNLQEIKDKEYSKDAEDRDMALLMDLDQNLAFARASVGNFTTEHTKLLGEIKYIEKSLKATRDDRIKLIQDGKSSWAGYLRMLEDEGQRKKIGREAELMRMAKDKARERLSEYHVYQDKTVDQPLLSSETVKDETEQRDGRDENREDENREDGENREDEGGQSGESREAETSQETSGEEGRTSSGEGED